jgi:hypothetical protein
VIGLQIQLFLELKDVLVPIGEFGCELGLVDLLLLDHRYESALAVLVLLDLGNYLLSLSQGLS